MSVNSMRRAELPLLGSNQDSPDPESGTPPGVAGPAAKEPGVVPSVSANAHTKAHTKRHTPGAYVAGEHHVLVSTKAGAVSSRLLGERGHNPGPTHSGRACLVELNDIEVPEVAPGDVLVAQFGYGLGPVLVDGVRVGIAGEGDRQFEVPVIDARIPTGQQLAFAPEELCRVREARA